MTEANSTTENVTHTPLTASDIDQIVDGLDNFCIGPVENDELRAIWQPYIDKLQAHRALLVAAPQLLDVAREFVAMYDGLRDSVGASVSERLARAEAAIAKATIAVLAVLLIASSAQAQEHNRLMRGLRQGAILAASSDIGTTATVLHQGGREVNPILQPPGTLAKAIVIDAGTLGGIYVLESRHPRIAKVLYVAVIATRGFATVHNARQIR